MKEMLNRSNFKLAALMLALLGTGIVILISMLTTTPKTIGPSGVTFWFIALLVFLSSLLALLLVGIKTRFRKGRQQMNRTVNGSFRTGFLLSLGLVTFLALRSLGTLGVKDVILLGLVLLLIEFYLRTRSGEHETT